MSRRLRWAREPFRNYDLIALETIGDGSCFFHAIIQAFYRPYINRGKPDKQGRWVSLERQKYVRSVRDALADMLSRPVKKGGKSYYETLSNGQLPTMSKAEPTLKCSLKEMEEELRSGNAVNNLYHEFISMFLNKDIFILDETNEDVYVIAGDDLLYQDRLSIIILYNRSDGEIGHYETVAVVPRDGGHPIAHFKPSHSLIVGIRARYREIKQNPHSRTMKADYRPPLESSVRSGPTIPTIPTVPTVPTGEGSYTGSHPADGEQRFDDRRYRDYQGRERDYPSQDSGYRAPKDYPERGRRSESENYNRSSAPERRTSHQYRDGHRDHHPAAYYRRQDSRHAHPYPQGRSYPQGRAYPQGRPHPESHPRERSYSRGYSYPDERIGHNSIAEEFSRPHSSSRSRNDHREDGQSRRGDPQTPDQPPASYPEYGPGRRIPVTGSREAPEA